MNATDPARVAALNALYTLWTEGGLLDERRFRSLSPEHRARAFRLSREVLRHEKGFDRIIRDTAERKPSPKTRAILHLALHEILIDQGSPHGVIHDWVEISKTQPGTERASGFINALLRKTSENRPKLIPTNQYGKALRAHLMQSYSASELDAINKLQSHYPPVDIYLKTGENLQDWAAKLQGEVIAGTRSIRLKNTQHISALEGFESGAWWVQDVAASLAAEQLGDIGGQSVLDLCAAPGGKTMQLADKGALVTAVEISKSRAKRIHTNLERTKLHADVIITDALAFAGGPFDAILLDAPCSATGTIRRHPDLRFDDPLKRMRTLVPLQAKLLSHAFSLLKPDGVLVYCTCSLLREEGEMQWQAFLERHENAHAHALTHPFTGETAPTLRILPNDLAWMDGCDGFFIAEAKKSAS